MFSRSGDGSRIPGEGANRDGGVALDLHLEAAPVRQVQVRACHGVWARSPDAHRNPFDASIGVKYGGRGPGASDGGPAEQKLDRDPWLRRIFAGYAFSIARRARLRSQSRRDAPGDARVRVRTVPRRVLYHAPPGAGADPRRGHRLCPPGPSRDGGRDSETLSPDAGRWPASRCCNVGQDRRRRIGGIPTTSSRSTRCRRWFARASSKSSPGMEPTRPRTRASVSKNDAGVHECHPVITDARTLFRHCPARALTLAPQVHATRGSLARCRPQCVGADLARLQPRLVGPLHCRHRRNNVSCGGRGPVGVRVIAFYLPQFHPIPENDEWWGPGFTEWRNVARARPLFPGHYQPHLPADLGFYDLRLPEVRAAQAELARRLRHRRVLLLPLLVQRPAAARAPVRRGARVGRAATSRSASAGRTRTGPAAWDGRDQEVLIAQEYSHEDDRAHIRHCCRRSRDPRYIRVDGRPLFLVYRGPRCPTRGAPPTSGARRPSAPGVGELYLCRGREPRRHRGPRRLGFDAAVEFAPEWRELGTPKYQRERYDLRARLYRRLRQHGWLPRRTGSTRSTATTRWPGRCRASPSVPTSGFAASRRPGTTHRAGARAR